MKKTNKENPFTTFRKLNQTRQGMVMKSLKKAQDGIQTNEDPENMMINKPGYGAKKSVTTSVNDDFYSNKPVYVKVKVGEKKLFKKRPVIEMSQSELRKIGEQKYNEYLNKNPRLHEEALKKLRNQKPVKFN